MSLIEAIQDKVRNANTTSFNEQLIAEYNAAKASLEADLIAVEGELAKLLPQPEQVAEPEVPETPAAEGESTPEVPVPRQVPITQG